MTTEQVIRVPAGLAWIWRFLPSLDQRLRYETPIHWLRSIDGPLLEVGSGTHGITRYVRRPTVGVDVRFGRFRLGHLEPVQGSVVALPFRDSQFPAVLSVDMLEHLPPDLRAVAVNELVRVAQRRLILVVPCEGGRQADQRLAKWLRPFGLPAWLQEHLEHGLPERTQVRAWLEEALRAKGVRARIREAEGLSANWWFWLALTGHWPPLRLMLHALLLPWAPLLARWGQRKPAYRMAFRVDLLP